MVKEAKQLESTILDHGERLINGSKVKRVQPTQGLKSFLDDVVPPKNQTRRVTSKSVRTTLKRITKRTPEVMVKVTGGGTSMAKIKAHMSYISRNGQLEAVDQDGNKIKGKADLEEVADEWQMSGSPISEDESNYKQAFNIVLSMPKGTNEQGVYEAAKEFAEEHFKDHKYMMVQHTYSNDPSKDPSENPHVHIVVKAISDKGKRLNPRKADLQSWRESFAEKLRSRGIEANATKRVHRMQKNRGEKQPVKQMKKKGKPFTKYGKGKASPERVEKAKTQEKEALGHYKHISQSLAKSPDPEDRKLAVDIVQYLSKQLDVKKPEVQINQEQIKEKPKNISPDR
ncbi:ABC transporter permease [Acinetobacter baumannii]|nr:ABC transporter permease [Acinetobacter baumannii]